MQETKGNILLTDLCAICHANSIKYTCPRCGIHTCSLPCVRRHKTWAQCSGIRNPTAYRKRAELATPASVDQDFNFITSVERSLQKADDLVLDKGIDLAPSGVNRHGHDPKRRFDTEVENRGIHLIKAPRGLSRNTQNKSHWTPKGIMWTTEWILYDGEKKFHNVIELRTVGEAFVAIFGKTKIRRKRKRSDAETTSVPATQPDTENTQPDSSHARIAQDQPTSTPDMENQDDGSKNEASSRDKRVQDPSDTLETGAKSLEISPIIRNLHFYLLRPKTMSKLKCLIPISPTSTLDGVLRDKTLLEFPTFHVRKEAPDALSEPFISDEKYTQVGTRRQRADGTDRYRREKGVGSASEGSRRRRPRI
ncbi:uncharacterized protein Z518_10814 [Rhinocladiella mackenziei CBS 650.93]|uniref:Box C/D snoRNA protein 1 n=1 Tax=Rhinocladiella mackenziei CBS 650.93 TaxID=1442369 RepID=A0A0D2FCS2_9EURO|nr:uncharacterized protein Z518_10814 [Rhinocladiella mackenziei CBS 650.93]KIW99886.1 hypothetical protein Z518_10814 [Rhinocladiella mackenziei CBS 650.93]